MRLFSNSTKRNLQIAAAALVVASTTSHAGEPSPVYTMTVFEDSNHGRMVTEGRYQQAIDTISTDPRRRANRFEIETNLCVAYAKLGNLDDAADTCGTAVDLARKRMKTTSSATYTAIARTQLALALSNRGVLNAALGERELAEHDFEEAYKLRTLLSAPKINLARLDAAATTRRPKR